LVDAVDYWVTRAQLRILGAVCDPEPKIPADEERQADHDLLREAFPEDL
jgi:hypothetical protein